jgi:hypothetical protein
VTRVEVSRHVAADPASVALLLAEPAGETEPDRGFVVVTPRRAGVGFTAAVAVTDAIGRVVTGEVNVEPATDAGCEIRVHLIAPDRAAARAVERTASTFLDTLAARARSRSFAA